MSNYSALKPGRKIELFGEIDQYNIFIVNTLVVNTETSLSVTVSTADSIAMKACNEGQLQCEAMDR